MDFQYGSHSGCFKYGRNLVFRIKKLKLDVTALLATLAVLLFALSPFLNACTSQLASLEPTRFFPGGNWVVMSDRLEQGTDVVRDTDRQAADRQADRESLRVCEHLAPPRLQILELPALGGVHVCIFL